MKSTTCTLNWVRLAIAHFVGLGVAARRGVVAVELPWCLARLLEVS
ncbi:MAG: hypothetical protein ACRDZ4_02110 [Egibacteraceae bacterium]